MASSEYDERSLNLPPPAPSASTIPPGSYQSTTSNNATTSPPDQQQVTVEMETVPSVPTLGVLNQAAVPNYTVRIKRSQDSVPRLTAAKGSSKRRIQRLAQGSRADFFAAKVANAVDEQDSSESDETFVYDTTQAPHSATQYSDSLRRTYTRTLSGMNSYLLHASPSPGLRDDYFGDDPDFETDATSDIPDHGEVPSVSPLKPNQMLSRHLVVTKRSHISQLPQSPQPISRSQLPHLPSEGEFDDPHWHPRLLKRESLAKNSSSQNFRPDQIREPRDSNDSVRAKHSYLQRWRTPTQSHIQQEDPATEEENGERTNLLRGRPSLYNYHSSRSSHGRRWHQSPPSSQANPGDTAGRDSLYSVEESELAKFHTGMSLTTRVIVFISGVLILILSMLFVGGVLLAASRPLQDFDVVSLSDVFVSDRELVFSMITHARNPGMFTKVINRGELDVFATSSHAEPFDRFFGASNHLDAESDIKKTRTVLLGTVRQLDSPISFHGGFSRATQWHAASAKLIGPLGNNTELWSAISSYEFDLTVKGILTYNILGSEHREPVSRAYHVKAPGSDENSIDHD